MYPDTQRDAVVRLERDFKFKVKGKYLRGGVCPNCKEKELWAHLEAPWKIQCSRLNHCGHEFFLREQYPDLFENWEKRFESTPENPTATVDAYLSEGRGFPLDKIKGLYSQEYFNDRKSGLGSVTVRFPLGQGINTGWFERLVDHKKPLPKTRNKPGWSSRGHCWQAPGVDWVNLKEIWVTEGVFDAIALWIAGIPAIAVLGSENYPQHFFHWLIQECKKAELKRPKIIWAFDADNAGKVGIEKNVFQAKEEGWESGAAQPPYGHHKIDWNDLFKQHRLGYHDLEKYRYYGNLLIAPRPIDKALLMYKHREEGSFPFDHGNRLYWFKLDIDKYDHAYKQATSDQDDWLAAEKEALELEARDNALKTSNTVTHIANCNPSPLYYQYVEDTDEAWYFFRIDFPRNAPSITNTFTGAQLSSSSEFKKRLLAVAPGVIYTGTGTQLDRVLGNLENIRRVQLINYVGYHAELETYVLEDVAIQKGKVFYRNKDEFFELPRKVNLKCNSPFPLTVNADAGKYTKEWIKDLVDAYGVKGLICLTAWFGSLFAHQIRLLHKSFPFTEIVGQPGTGKTTLLQFLWRLLGRDRYEGLDPHKTSHSGLTRSFRQVSNLPVALVESDRKDKSIKSQFDWDSIKTLYDGGSLGARGVKTQGNETYEPPFKGTVVISQNATVQSSEAILGRIVHLNFVKSDLTRNSLIASRKLSAYTVEQLSYFIVECLLKEADIMETYQRSLEINDKQLHDQEQVQSSRVIHNHAQFMALFEALHQNLFPSLDEGLAARVHAELADMAIARDKLLRSDSKIVLDFWDTYENIEATANKMDKTVLNHCRKANQFIGINFSQMYQVANQLRFNMPDLNELQEALRHSSFYQFVEANKSISSALENRTIRVWIFKKPDIKAQAE